MFLSTLEKHVPAIIGMNLDFFFNFCHLYHINFAENLSTIQIAGIDDQFEGKTLIMNLFYWFDSLRWSTVEQQPVLPTDSKVHNYLQQIIALKKSVLA